MSRPQSFFSLEYLQLSTPCDRLARHPEAYGILPGCQGRAYVAGSRYCMVAWWANNSYDQCYICELPQDWAVGMMLMWSFLVMCTNAGSRMSFRICSTCGPPLSLGLEPFRWIPVLAHAYLCCECRITSSLPHPRAAGLEARIFYSWSFAVWTQSSCPRSSVDSMPCVKLSLGVAVFVSPQECQDCYFAVPVDPSNLCPLLPWSRWWFPVLSGCWARRRPSLPWECSLFL